MDATTYTIRIHFPYSQIVLTEKTEVQKNRIQNSVSEGVAFLINEATSEFLVNPALVTYVEITPARVWV